MTGSSHIRGGETLRQELLETECQRRIECFAFVNLQDGTCISQHGKILSLLFSDEASSKKGKDNKERKRKDRHWLKITSNRREQSLGHGSWRPHFCV